MIFDMDLESLIKRNDRCVYCLEFPNGMKYVGKTGNLGSRLRLYVRNVESGEGGKVCDALKEFGFSEVGLSVLASVSGMSKDDTELCLGILEIKYIREMDCVFPKGYNVSFGGEVLRIPPEYITTDSEAIKAFKSGSKSVLVYDIEGNFLSEYDSLARMDYELGLSEKDYAPFLDKKKPIADKYYIRSKKYNVIPRRIEVPVWVVNERVKYNTTIEERTIVKEKTAYGCVAALAYDLNGDFVGEYKNRAEASRMLTGVQRMGWGKYCKGYILYKKTSDDYPKKIESYLEVKNKALGEEYKPLEELGDMPKPTLKNGGKYLLKNDRPINQFTLDGEFVAQYPSLRTAASEQDEVSYSQIYACVNGKTHRGGPYIWQWANATEEDFGKNVGNVDSLF